MSLRFFDQRIRTFFGGDLTVFQPSTDERSRVIVRVRTNDAYASDSVALDDFNQLTTDWLTHQGYTVTPPELKEQV